MKTISWNHVSLKLPEDWEVTSEGGTTINGVIIAAPPEGAKLEIYWRRSKSGKKPFKDYESYLSKLEKKGYNRKSRLKINVKTHQGYMDILTGKTKVLTASWRCSETERLFITQMDGVKASQTLFSQILSGINCHPIINEKVEWRLMGIGLRLYSGYFIVERVFKIGFSMAYLLSRDKKIHVVQFALPSYVAVDKEKYGETRERIIKRIVPRMTILEPIEKNNVSIYYIRHKLVKPLKYGVLVERVNKCIKPDYVQTTLVKAPEKRLDEAVEIARDAFCTEW